MEDRFHSVLTDACGGELDYVGDVEPRDLEGQFDSQGNAVAAAVARGLVRKVATQLGKERDKLSRMKESLERKEVEKTECKPRAVAQPPRDAESDAGADAQDGKADNAASSSKAASGASPATSSTSTCGPCGGRGCVFCRGKPAGSIMAGSRVELLVGQHAGGRGEVTRSPDVMGTVGVRLDSGEQLEFVKVANCRKVLSEVLSEMGIEPQFHGLLTDLCNGSPRQLGYVARRDLEGHADLDGCRIEAATADGIILKLRLGPPSRPTEKVPKRGLDNVQRSPRSAGELV